MYSITELYAAGQYDAVKKYLEDEQTSGAGRSIATQLVHAQNVAVIDFMMRKDKGTGTTTYPERELRDVLLKCASVPVSADMLYVELVALYNYTHGKVTSLGGNDANTLPIYDLLLRTLQRVDKLNVVQEKSATLFDKDSYTQCKMLLERCAVCLQFTSVSSVLISMLCACIVVCIIQEMRLCYFTKANSLLTIVANLLGNIKTDVKTENCFPEVLLVPIYVDHSQLSLTSVTLQQLVDFLKAVCLSNQGNNTDVSTLLEHVGDPVLKPTAKFLSGLCLYKRSQYTDAVCTLMEVLRSQPTITQRLRARIYSLTAKCFSEMGKHQLCIHMNKEALSADFSYLVPLFHTSLQYRNLNDADMELDCLNLLVKALEMRDLSTNSHDGLDLLMFVSADDQDISYPRALYTLANHSLQLQRYDTASEKYMQLLEYLKSWQADVYEDLSCVPSLLQVHHEALEALLKNKQYDDCIALCDKVIACHQNNHNMSVLGSPVVQTGYSQSSQSFEDSLKAGPHSESASKHKCDGSSQMETDDNYITTAYKKLSSQTQIGRKAKRKFNDLEEDGSSIAGKHIGNVDTVALKIKAEALVKLGQNEAAFKCLQSAIDGVSSDRRKRWDEFCRKCLEPSSKRAKLVKDELVDNRLQNEDTTGPGTCDSGSKNQNLVDSGGDCSSYDINSRSQGNTCGSYRSVGNSKALALEHQLYTMAASVLGALDRNHDAVHFQRLASQLNTLF